MASLTIETFVPPSKINNNGDPVTSETFIHRRTIPIASLPNGQENSLDITPYYFKKSKGEKRRKVPGKRNVSVWRDPDSGCVIVKERHRFSSIILYTPVTLTAMIALSEVIQRRGINRQEKNFTTTLHFIRDEQDPEVYIMSGSSPLNSLLYQRISWKQDGGDNLPTLPVLPPGEKIPVFT